MTTYRELPEEEKVKHRAKLYADIQAEIAKQGIGHAILEGLLTAIYRLFVFALTVVALFGMVVILLGTFCVGWWFVGNALAEGNGVAAFLGTAGTLAFLGAECALMVQAWD